MASAQMVLPVPDGPAKLNAKASPVGCRWPSPQRLKMRSWLVTWASAWSRARRVGAGRMTSLKVRRGTRDSTARLVPVRVSNRRLSGNGAKMLIMTPDTLVSIGVGLALAAAAGFRVFVPLLALSLAAQGGWVELSPSFAWLATTPASVALGTATVLEVGAY